MRTKQTTLATAIALSLATSGLVASGQVWADTSTRSLKAVIDRGPGTDGTITINAGETINLSALGIDQEGKVDTRGEQLGAVIFMSVATDKGEIFVGSDTPGERENNPDPVVGGFALLPPGEKPFNNLKYVRLVQGAGRANIYYPPTINTPPIVEPTATTTDNRQYDECCGLPCADKLPAGTLNCPTDTRPEDAVKLEPVVENVKVTLQERFLNKSGGVEYKVIDTVNKKINIMPAIPHVRKLEITKFEAGPRDRIGTRAGTPCQAADKISKKCDDDSTDGIEGHMTAGVAGARVTVWALRDAPGQAKGLGKDPAANGRLVLKLVAVADRKMYKELPAVNMLNGEGQVTFPADLTLAADFYIEIELRLAVNGHTDATNPQALPTVVNNVDMFTADKVIVEPTKKVAKLKLESIKKVISDDANPPQGTPFNPGAAWNSATQITVYALDEYGNKTQLPAGTPTKVTVKDDTSTINAGSLNLDFNSDPNRKMAKDWVGDAFGDVLKLGETSLVATIDGSGAAASDPLKIKVVAKNLVARPYAGSATAGDAAYGDATNYVPAASAPYPTSTTRYKPNTTNVVKDLQAGTSVKAFSVAVDGGRLNGIPNGLFDDYKSPVDGSILPNLADGANSDDDFVSKTNAAAIVINTRGRIR